VSGAIGILETSLNGEYIILENLSSNKNINLKGWYIHRYVPDQGVNLIFKFTTDTIIHTGEKLKIASACHSCRPGRTASMYESMNNKDQLRDRPDFVNSKNLKERVIVADNIDNWGVYSKFSVTKLINQEGVDKAVLTQSLLRLASSTSQLNNTQDGALDDQNNKTKTIVCPKAIETITTTTQKTLSSSSTSDFHTTTTSKKHLNETSSSNRIASTNNNNNNNTSNQNIETIGIKIPLTSTTIKRQF
jgi:hypothetical protein